MSETIDKKPAEKIQVAAQQAARAESEPSPVRHYRALVLQAALLIIALAFAVLTYLVKAMPFFAVDLKITKAIQSIQFPFFVVLMDAVSWPGFSPQSFIFTILIVLLIYTLGLRWEAVAASIAAVFASGVNVLVKDLVQRPRPASDLVKVFATLNSYSFPSGHVMFYLGFYGFIWMLAFSLLKPSIMRTFLLIFFGSMILLVGVSRVYQGEHWPSDVLGSYLLGTLTLVAIIRIYVWGKQRFFVRQPVAPAGAAEK
jgi:undecaprenyl-diphosphatase